MSYHHVLHRDYSTCWDYHPEKKYWVSYTTIQIEMPQKCNNHYHEAVDLSFWLRLDPSLEYQECWLNEDGEVSIFYWGTKRVTKVGFVPAYTYAPWLCHPSSLAGRQKPAARETIVQVQATWWKALHQSMFHTHSHCIHEISGHYRQGQHWNDRKAWIEDTAKNICQCLRQTWIFLFRQPSQVLPSWWILPLCWDSCLCCENNLSLVGGIHWIHCQVIKTQLS